MEQQPPSRSNPPPPPPPPGGGPAAPSRDAAPKAPAAPKPAPADGSTPAGVGAVVCPACGEPRGEDVRYCEECGHDFESEAAIPAPVPSAEEKSGFSGPVLWIILLFWIALAIGGLIFLYTALWSL